MAASRHVVACGNAPSECNEPNPDATTPHWRGPGSIRAEPGFTDLGVPDGLVAVLTKGGSEPPTSTYRLRPSPTPSSAATSAGAPTGSSKTNRIRRPARRADQQGAQSVSRPPSSLPQPASSLPRSVVNPNASRPLITSRHLGLRRSRLGRPAPQFEPRCRRCPWRARGGSPICSVRKRSKLDDVEVVVIDEADHA